MSLRTLLPLALATLVAPAFADLEDRVHVPCRGTENLEIRALDGSLVTTVVDAADEAEGISLDGEGNVWITRQGSKDDVIKLDADGVWLTTVPMSGEPFGVAAAADGTVWVSQKSPDELVQIDGKAGTILQSIPLSGDPRGVCVDFRGHVFVAVYEDDTVEHFSETGAYIATIAVDDGPWSIAASPLCCVWVVNHKNCTLWCIDSNDNVSLQIGFSGFPRDVAVDRDGNLAVCMQDDERVDLYDRAGNAAGSLAVGDEPTSIAFDANGDLWVVAEDDDELSRLVPNTATRVDFPTGDDPRAFGDFTGLAYANIVDPRGDADGDGYMNRNEVTSGSSPFDPLDVPAAVVALDPAQAGTTLRIQLDDFHNPGETYQAWLSLSVSPPFPLAACWPCDPRTAYVNVADPLFQLTFDPSALPGIGGVFDGSGRSQFTVPLPLSLPPTTFYAGYITLDGLVHPSLVRTLALPLQVDTFQ